MDAQKRVMGWGLVTGRDGVLNVLSYPLRSQHTRRLEPSRPGTLGSTRSLWPSHGGPDTGRTSVHLPVSAGGHEAASVVWHRHAAGMQRVPGAPAWAFRAAERRAPQGRPNSHEALPCPGRVALGGLVCHHCP